MIFSSVRKQNGAALIISLVILIAMTLLALTSMKGTSTELAMAGNLRESALSFQAAEVGLRAAEARLDNNNDPANVIDDSALDLDYLDKASWTSAAATEAADVSLPNISENPRYIIKYLGQWNPDIKVSSLDPGFSGYGQTSTALKVDYFRSTARGSGQVSNTFRTVQSFYGRKSN